MDNQFADYEKANRDARAAGAAGRIGKVKSQSETNPSYLSLMEIPESLQKTFKKAGSMTEKTKKPTPKKKSAAKGAKSGTGTVIPAPKSEYEKRALKMTWDRWEEHQKIKNKEYST